MYIIGNVTYRICIIGNVTEPTSTYVSKCLSELQKELAVYKKNLFISKGVEKKNEIVSKFKNIYAFVAGELLIRYLKKKVNIGFHSNQSKSTKTFQGEGFGCHP